VIEWIARGLAAFVALGTFWSVWISLRSGATRFMGGDVPILRSDSPMTYAAIIAVHIAAAAACAAVALGLVEMA
jgi:hypothetical protein